MNDVLPKTSVLNRYPNTLFWLTFLACNLLLFLPLYLLNVENSTFFPDVKLPFWHWATFKTLGQYRNNFDIFRLNVELSVLATLWVLIRPLRRRVGSILFTVLCLFLFCYYLYEAITVSFFLVDPIFYNQYFMAIDGLGFLLQHLNISLLYYALAFCLCLSGAFFIMRLFQRLWSIEQGNRIHWISRVVMVVLCGLAAASIWRFEISLANPVMAVSSVSYKLQKNINESLEIAASMRAYRHEVVENTYSYDDYTLNQRPDIYFLLIESYGSVLYKRPHFRPDYLALLDELDGALQQDGWQVASNLSTAPTWGGGSWMSYASLLFGLRIETHPEFLFLRNRYQFETYPDIGHFLKQQAYAYFRISPLSVEMTAPEWQQYINFYGVDRWLRYRDMNYTGTRYSWGPSPPEQYSLGFIQQEMERTAPDAPHLMFLITQNSHYPWNPLPPLLENWQDFNQQPVPGIVPAGDLTGLDAQRQNYLGAIEYELRAVVDFILDQENRDAIFILVGDHQPPRVARRDDGFETPMHIISRNGDFQSRLKEYGFAEGLKIIDQTNPIKHEGFLSLFVRELIATYGEPGTALPSYLPDGVTMPAVPD